MRLLKNRIPRTCCFTELTNLKRLQGEVIRDTMLAISGRLDRKLFGQPVPVHLTAFRQGRGRPNKSGPLEGNGRRSIYVSVNRNFLSPMMLAFDTPIPFTSIGRRSVSSVPAQALILMNDPFVIEQASRWAQRILSEATSTHGRIQSLYEPDSLAPQMNTNCIRPLNSWSVRQGHWRLSTGQATNASGAIFVT